MTTSALDEVPGLGETARRRRCCTRFGSLKRLARGRRVEEIVARAGLSDRADRGGDRRRARHREDAPAGSARVRPDRPGRCSMAESRPSSVVGRLPGCPGRAGAPPRKCLEDLGCFVVDNLPPALIADDGRPRQPRAAARSPGSRWCVDVRSRAFSADLRGAIKELDERGYRPRVLFLEAADDVLVRRFENVRRPHPLQGDGRLVDGIAAERELLADAARGGRPRHRHLPTSTCTDLRRQLERAFGGEDAPALRVDACSRSASSTACRWTPTSSSTCGSCPTRTGSRSCATHTGRTPTSRDYVLSPGGRRRVPRPLRSSCSRLVGGRLPARGQALPDAGVGCTGGKHRSVAIAEELAAPAGRRRRPAVSVAHRDLGRE